MASKQRGSDGASAPVDAERSAYVKVQRSLQEHDKRNGRNDQGRRREELISGALHGTSTHPQGDTRSH